MQPLTQANALNLSNDVVRSAAFKANPYPFYADLRTNAPVFPLEKAHRGMRAWLITRYDDTVAVFKDDKTFVKNMEHAMTPEQYRKAPKMPAAFSSLSTNLLSQDVPDHTRLKALVHKAFTPRMIQQMQDEAEAITTRLLDEIAAQRGSVDLIKAYAAPLPLTLIGRIMGVPEKDTDKFRRWTNNFVAIGAATKPLGAMIRVPGMMQFVAYIRRLVQKRTQNPQDDLISALVTARENDERLTEDEIVAMIFLLLSAGHETTVNLIASGTLALLRQRDQWEQLRTEPDLARPAVEELLRYVTPVEMATERYTACETTIAGVTIPRGELVLNVIAAANRDPNRFDNPEQLDITRTNNKHLSFGQGIHYCVGAPLARMEGQIAITRLTERFPNLGLAVPDDQIEWHSNLILRGLKTLPVVTR